LFSETKLPLISKTRIRLTAVQASRVVQCEHACDSTELKKAWNARNFESGRLFRVYIALRDSLQQKSLVEFGFAMDNAIHHSTSGSEIPDVSFISSRPPCNHPLD
jgi:hypothetical protein